MDYTCFRGPTLAWHGSDIAGVEINLERLNVESPPPLFWPSHAVERRKTVFKCYIIDF